MENNRYISLTNQQDTMALFNFFKTPKPMRFEYKPKYWDPEKEKLEELKARMESSESGDVEAVKVRIAEAFARGGNKKLFAAERRKKSRQTNFIRLALILLMALLAYLVLTVYLPKTGLYFE